MINKEYHPVAQKGRSVGRTLARGSADVLATEFGAEPNIVSNDAGVLINAFSLSCNIDHLGFVIMSGSL
jgi:hypothetical protein